MSTCVVFVCNGKYLNKFKNTLQSLRKNGQYNGEVLLIIGNDLKEKENEIKETYNVEVKYLWFGIIKTLLSNVTALVVLILIFSTLPILPSISIISPTWTVWSAKIKIPEIISWKKVCRAKPTPTNKAADAAKIPVKLIPKVGKVIKATITKTK